MNGADQNCEHIGDLLDFYLDGELSQTEMLLVKTHIEKCSACREEETSRLALRERLRKAARSTPVPRTLPGRGLVNTAVPQIPVWRQPAYLAMAAAAVVIVSFVSWNLTHLRTSVASQDAFIAALSSETAPIVRVGLADHVHCAVFRKFPDQPPTASEMTAKLGADYADLLPVMKSSLPPDMTVAIAHKCRYKGRQYVHLVGRNSEGRLISLVIAKRDEGEAFERDLRAVVSGSDVQMYSAGVRNYAIAGFETPKHLVYLISDENQTDNLRLMNSMSAEVRRVLSRMDS